MSEQPRPLKWGYITHILRRGVPKKESHRLFGDRLIQRLANMDFFLDLFDSEKKRARAESKRNRAGSSEDLPPPRAPRGHNLFNFRKYDNREPNRFRDERLRRELHRLYLWDGKLTDNPNIYNVQQRLCFPKQCSFSTVPLCQITIFKFVGVYTKLT